MATSHMDIQAKLVKYMEDHGWKQEVPTYGFWFGGLADESFVNENGQRLFAEVKPERNGFNELWNGIGQTARTLIEPDKECLSILVCSRAMAQLAEQMLYVIGSDRLGLLTYDEWHTFAPVINIWSGADISWISKLKERKTKLAKVIASRSQKRVIHKEPDIQRNPEEFKRKLIKKLIELTPEKDISIHKTPEELIQFLIPFFNFSSKRDLGIQMKSLGFYTKVLFVNNKYSRYYILTRQQIEEIIDAI